MNGMRVALWSAAAFCVLIVALACSGKSGPTPRVVAVEPDFGPVTTDVSVLVLGEGFSPMAAGAAEGSPEILVPTVFLEGTARTAVSAVFVSSTAMRATVPSGIATGLYGFTVVNPNGKSFTLSSAYTAVLPSPLTVTGVFPSFGWTEEETPVTISGAGFQSTPRARLLTIPPSELERVAFLDSATLTAVVPAGLPVGTYDLDVTNPDGSYGVLTSAFTVTLEAPPRIDSVTPSLGDTSSTTAVTIEGANFPPDATVDLVDAAGTLTPCTVNSVTGTTTISATVPAGMTEGNYLVRVTRLSDGAFDEFAVFTITQPSGDPGPWAAQTSLPDGRRGLSLVSASDDLGNTYLYAIGGERTDGAGAIAETYRSIASARVSVFGDIGTWRTEGSEMARRRTSLASWSHNGYVFAAGGFDETPAALQDVERAKVLRFAGAPRQLEATAAAGGSLAQGTWYYRVSAVVDDADNPGGETLPSDFAVVTTEGGGQVTLTWDAPAEGSVLTYRLYRTPSANGALGEERLLAEGISVTSFMDAGTDTVNAAIAPKPAGSLGVWVTLLDGLTAPRAAAGVTVARAPDAGGGYGDTYVYLIGGTSAPGAIAPYADYEYVMLPASGGDVGGFTRDTTNVMTSARMEPASAAANAFNASAAVADGVSYVYTLGGRDPTVMGPTGFPVTIEVGTAQANGTLSWQVLTTTSIADAGGVSVVANGYVWLIGGWGGAGTYRNTVFTGEISPANDPALVNFNNTGETLPTAKYRSGGTYLRSHVFVAGGTSDGNNTLSDVISAVF